MALKQVDRLLSNRGVDVWAFFAYWTPFIVAARTEVVVALDWTSFAADGQDTIVLSMVTGHGRATPLLWKTVASSTLKGLQHIWCDEALRARLFVLLDEHILPEADRTVGRPGMDLWQILVLGVLKQGLGCDFDRLHDLTNHHQTIRAFLGHGDFDDQTRYEYQTVVDNVSLLTPELLSAVGRLVVESGHKVAKKKLGEPLRGRCDSFVVETDVHYPTDVSLLWDAVRCLLRETGLTAEQYAVRGWRQWRHLSREVKKLFNKVRSTRRAPSTTVATSPSRRRLPSGRVHRTRSSNSAPRYTCPMVRSRISPPSVRTDPPGRSSDERRLTMSTCVIPGIAVSSSRTRSVACLSANGPCCRTPRCRRPAAGS